MLRRQQRVADLDLERRAHRLPLLSEAAVSTTIVTAIVAIGVAVDAGQTVLVGGGGARHC